MPATLRKVYLQFLDLAQAGEEKKTRMTTTTTTTRTATTKIALIAV
jgi:hypothetical protein